MILSQCRILRREANEGRSHAFAEQNLEPESEALCFGRLTPFYFLLLQSSFEGHFQGGKATASVLHAHLRMYRLRRRHAGSLAMRQSSVAAMVLQSKTCTLEGQQRTLMPAHLRTYRLRRRDAGSLAKRRFRTPANSIMRLSFRRSSLGFARKVYSSPLLPMRVICKWKTGGLSRHRSKVGTVQHWWYDVLSLK